MVCSHCVTAGYCRQNKVRYFTDAETKDPTLVRLVRDRARILFHSKGISPMRLRDYLTEQYAKLDITIIDAFGNEYLLPTEILDPPDAFIDTGLARKFDEELRQYIKRTFYTPLLPCVMPRVTHQYKDWFVLIATLVMALCANETAFWPRRFGGNDNVPRIPTAANDNVAQRWRS